MTRPVVIAVHKPETGWRVVTGKRKASGRLLQHLRKEGATLVAVALGRGNPIVHVDLRDVKRSGR